MVEIKYLFLRLVLKCYLKENIWSTLILSITKVRSRSLCTWEKHDNFIISGSISKIVGPER